MWTRILLAAAASALAVLPATTSTADDTDTSFTLLGGTLAISTPASTDLGSHSVNALLFSGQLGDVTVTDDRGALAAAWTATVSSTNFTTGAASTSETVANANVAYSSGPAVTTGTGVFTPSVALGLALPGAAGVWTGVGSNSATWDPTIAVTLAPGRVAGVYTGTITHSVA
ncbi:MAG: hypothetical protein ACRDY4_03450 [Acidimicrobiia bacterium]